MSDIGEMVRDGAIAITVIGAVIFGMNEIRKYDGQKRVEQGEANYARYEHLLELADVDNDGVIGLIEEKLLIERVPFLKEWDKYDRSIYDVNVGTLTPACSFRDKQVYTAVKQYESELE